MNVDSTQMLIFQFLYGIGSKVVDVYQCIWTYTMQTLENQHMSWIYIHINSNAFKLSNDIFVHIQFFKTQHYII